MNLDLLQYLPIYLLTFGPSISRMKRNTQGFEPEHINDLALEPIANSKLDFIKVVVLSSLGIFEFCRNTLNIMMQINLS